MSARRVPVLEARNLRQRAGGHRILHGCQFTLWRGCTALVGPNGAGKTTLLRILAGITQPHAGSLSLGGLPATPRALYHAVGYVPQFPRPHGRLTALGHLERLGLWAGLPQPREAALEALERLGLSRLAHTPCARLHQGAWRRLALAEIWVRRCRAVLCDEPTADLDPEERARFWIEITRLLHSHDGPESVLVSTHLFAEVAAHCDEVAVLDCGHIAFAGSVSELADRARGRTYSDRGAGPLPAAATVVGMGDGGDRLLLAGSPAPPLPLPERPPTPLDGFLCLRAEAR